MKKETAMRKDEKSQLSTIIGVTTLAIAIVVIITATILGFIGFITQIW